MNPNCSHHLTLAQAVHRGPLMSSFLFAPPGTMEDLEVERRRINAMKLPDDPAFPKPPEKFSLTTENRALFASELNEYVRLGRIGPTARRFSTITTGEVGSNIEMPADLSIPLGIAPDNSFRLAHTLLGVPPAESALSSKMNWPVINPAAGSVVEENDTSSSTEATLAGVPFSPKTFDSGIAWFSNQVITTGFDVVAWLLPYLRANKDLAFETDITGTILADESIAQVSSTSVSTISMANLQSLRNTLSRRFRRLRVIMLGSAAYEAAQTTTGSDGQYVLQPHPTIEGVSYFRGTLVLENENFEDFGANKTIGAVLSLRGARIRDTTVENLARAQQDTRPAQTGITLFGYHAFGYLSEAIVKLVTPAS